MISTKPISTAMTTSKAPPFNPKKSIIISTAERKRNIKRPYRQSESSSMDERWNKKDVVQHIWKFQQQNTIEILRESIAKRCWYVRHIESL